MDAAPVFVYGTLTRSTRVSDLLEDWRFAGAAVLEGVHRVNGRYPTLAPGGQTAGRLLQTPQLAVLDGYEGVDTGLYVRVAVPVVDGGQAWVYIGDPNRLEAAADWPGTGPFAERVRTYIESAPVRLRRPANR